MPAEVGALKDWLRETNLPSLVLIFGLADVEPSIYTLTGYKNRGFERKGFFGGADSGSHKQLKD